MRLFVAAEPRECRPWVARWENVRPAALPVHWARQGTWKGAEVLAIANGAGADRAHAAVLAAPRPASVSSIGFCGALDPSLSVGDVFVGLEIRNGNLSYPALDPLGPPSRSGLLASTRRIAQTAEEKRKLRASGAFAVEMEAAGAARASQYLGIAFYCIKAVSDLADENFEINFNKFLMPDGRFNVPRLIFSACGSPVRRFRELIRLSKRTALAADSLGEFLANCSY